MIQGGIDLEFLKLFLPKVRIGPRGGVGWASLWGLQLQLLEEEREREWERMGTVGGSLFLLALKKKRIRKGYEIESYFKGNFWKKYLISLEIEVKRMKL